MTELYTHDGPTIVKVARSGWVPAGYVLDWLGTPEG